MEFLHLTVDDVLEIHLDQTQRYGGDLRIRDLKLLQSALAQPNATFDGTSLHHDVFEAAAAYLFHLVSNHPFIDGNKRTGAVCAFVFLHLNGWELKVSEEEFEALVWKVAEGSSSKEEITHFFRQHCREHVD